MNNRIGMALLAATAAFAVSGCMTGDYGYGGVSLGYNSGYYASPYWGWYDNYYYPGTGYYIYDRGGGRHHWNDSQRRYWESRRGSRQASENWSGYRGGQTGGTGQASPQRREAWRAQNQGLSDQTQQQRREAWQAQRQQQGASGQTWQQRREAWRAPNQAPAQAQPAPQGGNGWSRGNRGGRGDWNQGN